MKLSIIIPTYNSSKVLSRALNSIISQSFSDCEILIMDGASSDDTIHIAQSYDDSRIRVFSEKDRGVYDAMNKGIKKAKGEWVYFLGSDDWLLDNTVLNEVFSQAIDAYDVIYGDVESERDMSMNIGRWTYDNIVCNRCHQGIFYKKNILERFNGYNLKYQIYADWDLNLKWFLNRKVKYLYLGMRIAHFSDNGMSSISGDKLFWEDFNKLVLKYGFVSLPVRLKAHYVKQYIKQSSCGQILLSIWSKQ